MRPTLLAASRLPRNRPVIIDATTVATAWCEFPSTSDSVLDQATSITREEAPEKKRQAASRRRAAGVMFGSLASDGSSWRRRTGTGIRNRVRRVGIERSLAASLPRDQIIEGLTRRRDRGVGAGGAAVCLQVVALQTDVIEDAARQPGAKRPRDRPA